MTLELLTERDAELERCRSGWGRARVIGKSGEVGYGTHKARIDAAGIDRKLMAVPCVVTTQDEDNSLDIIITDGIDLEIHKANPVVKFDHGQSLGIPIGKAQAPDGTYTVTREPGLLKAITYFSQTNLEAEQLFQLCEEGILNGVSIGAIPILDRIEKRNVTNWKGLNGLIVRGCRMFEYSHTPSPDNPQALTDRILGGKLLAGKSISGALYKSFEPFLIASPSQITVPALAAEVVKQLKAEGAVVVKKDGGYEAVTQQAEGKPGETPKPEEKPAESKPEEKTTEANDPTADYPPGAKAIAGLHDRATEMLAFIGESAKGQENPAVKDLLASMTDELAEKCDALKSFFKDNYGDVGELKEPDADAEEGADEGRTQKSLRKIKRYVLPYRKSILASVPAASARDDKLTALEADKVKLAEESAQLRKALATSLDQNEKLRSRFNKARMGQ